MDCLPRFFVDKEVILFCHYFDFCIGLVRMILEILKRKKIFKLKKKTTPYQCCCWS